MLLNHSAMLCYVQIQPPTPGSTLPAIANDTIGLLFTMTSSYSHVTDALEKLKDTIGIEVSLYWMDVLKLHRLKAIGLLTSVCKLGPFQIT